HPQPSLRREGADGGPHLRCGCAGRRLRARARELLPASRDNREVTRGRSIALVLVTVPLLLAAEPTPARAGLLKPLCGIAGAVNKLAGGVCNVAQNPGRIVKAGGKLI